MNKKKNENNVATIEKKASKVICDLLKSDDEKLKLQAAKSAAFELGSEAISELLESSDDKVKLQAAKHALSKIQISA